ncbi:hypothetical protein ONZ45_g3289 [Pleurotus djamor]|nr:hypothetical protein ONZ45_g3289 [Pleurotus djamor]
MESEGAILTQSKDFWMEGEGGTVFRVENTLYRVHREALASRSAVFKGMYLLPQPEDEVAEGVTWEKPIILPGATAKEFEYLLRNCIDFRWRPPPYPVEEWEAVLKLSNMWGILGGRKQAIHELEKYSLLVLGAVERLRIARMHRVPELVRRGFSALAMAKWEITTLKIEDVQKLGLDTFETLAKVKAHIERERKKLAFNEPKIDRHDIECTNHNECRKAWKDAWWLFIGREVHCPEATSAMSPNELGRKVDEMRVPGMHPKCRLAVMMKAKAARATAGMEDIIEAGVIRLEQLWTSIADETVEDERTDGVQLA